MENQKIQEDTQPAEKFLNKSSKKIQKRAAFHSPAKTNEIYVRHHLRFGIYLKRIIKLFNEGKTKVYIYGLGASIEKAVKLALKAESLFYGIRFNIKTSSVKLIDDHEIEGEDQVVNVQPKLRTNSSISIEVIREL